MTYLIKLAVFLFFALVFVCIVLLDSPSWGWLIAVGITGAMLGYGSHALAEDLIEVHKRSKHWKHYY